MKLWLLSQNTVLGYDTYDSCVVAAETEEEAKMLHPSGCQEDVTHALVGKYRLGCGSWPETTQEVEAEYLGEAVEGTKAGVICASFNAG